MRHVHADTRLVSTYKFQQVMKERLQSKVNACSTFMMHEAHLEVFLLCGKHVLGSLGTRITASQVISDYIKVVGIC